MAGIRIVVGGRVQGVGFRYFTQQLARSLGIAGEVWNRPDGAVEIEAEHEDQSVLDEFVIELRSGPGYVRDVHVEPRRSGDYEEFGVGPTR